MFSNPNYMSGHIPSSTAPVFTEQQQHRLIMGPPRLRKYQKVSSIHKWQFPTYCSEHSCCTQSCSLKQWWHDQDEMHSLKHFVLKLLSFIRGMSHAMRGIGCYRNLATGCEMLSRQWYLSHKLIVSLKGNHRHPAHLIIWFLHWQPSILSHSVLARFPNVTFSETHKVSAML